jgi:hypothetical protein
MIQISKSCILVTGGEEDDDCPTRLSAIFDFSDESIQNTSPMNYSR